MKIQNNLVFKYLNLNYIWPFITFFLIIIVPQIYFYQDLWDGTIYNYAQDINNFDSAKLILYEAGWILNFWFIFLTIKISNFFNIEFYTTSLIFLSFFYLFFLREISLFLEHERIKDPKIKLFILLLVSAFSIQSYFYSSIFVWHSFCQLCFFMGVRLYYESSNLKFLFSLLLLFFAFSFKSALLFIIILSFTYEKKISSGLDIKNGFLTDFLQYSINSGLNVKAVLTNDVWVEIDTVQDYLSEVNKSRIYKILFEDGFINKCKS